MKRLAAGLIASIFLMSTLLFQGCSTEVRSPSEAEEYRVDDVIPGAQQTEEREVVLPPEQEEIGPVIYDPAKPGFYALEKIGANEELYRVLYAAAEGGRETADVSDLNPDSEAVARASRAIMECSDLEEVKHMDLDADAETVTIRYSDDRQIYVQEREIFRAAAREILQTVCGKKVSTAGAVARIYQYLSANIALDTAQTDGGLLPALSQGRTDALGMARLMRYLLDQMDVEAHITFNEDGEDVWNTVRIDGAYYHLDAARQAMEDGGRTYQYFGLSDGELQRRMFAWNSGEEEERYDTPEAVQERFFPLQECRTVAVDFEAERYFVTEASAEGTPIVARDFFTHEEIGRFTAEAGNLAFYGGKLYFSDTRDSLKLKALDLENGQTDLVADLEVTRLICRADGLYAYDDVRGEEKTIR